jgi:DNA-binding LacI/PurR family transcriptional regulator
VECAFGQLSIVGYDDSHIASPSAARLTTIAQDAPALAHSALDLAMARAENRTEDRSEIVIRPSLVVRATDGPAD